jgi:nitrite reductase (NADH) small subunit
MNPSCLAEHWTAICRLEDIPKQGSRVVQRAGREPIAVFRSADDYVFAMIDRCPHKGGPLSAGLVHGHAVTCPLHGWTIGLENGQAHAPDEGSAVTIETRTESGRVYLNLAGAG